MFVLYQSSCETVLMACFCPCVSVQQRSWSPEINQLSRPLSQVSFSHNLPLAPFVRFTISGFHFILHICELFSFISISSCKTSLEKHIFSGKLPFFAAGSFEFMLFDTFCFINRDQDCLGMWSLYWLDDSGSVVHL